MQKLSLESFTPTVTISLTQEDLKLLFIRSHHPNASWAEISQLLRTQFRINRQAKALKHRYEQYLNIPCLKQQESSNLKHPFVEKKSSPEDYLEMYRQIKQYHEKTSTTKRE